MESHWLERTWIVCGSYATVHAAQLEAGDLIALENSTGASFGLACYGDRFDYTRMLTPYRDFHAGIDDALKLWGIQANRFEFDNKTDIPLFLDKHPNMDCVLGPLNMACIRYLPRCTQYRYADHTICVRALSEGKYYIVDSEGIPGIVLNTQELLSMLSVAEIPEARGKFILRLIFHPSSPLPRREIFLATLNKAYDNLLSAEADGEGSFALHRCAELMRETHMSRWKTSLLYSLGDLSQRKMMFVHLANNLRRANVCKVSPDFFDFLQEQMKLSMNTYDQICTECIQEAETTIRKMAETERRLAYGRKEWFGT